MSKGPAFFDSNVLIASAIPSHPHHAASAARLSALQRTGGACAAHTLAEAYSQLTRSKNGYGVPPSDALRILERVASIFQLIALEPQETLATIAARARDGIASGTV